MTQHTEDLNRRLFDVLDEDAGKRACMALAGTSEDSYWAGHHAGEQRVWRVFRVFGLLILGVVVVLMVVG